MSKKIILIIGILVIIGIAIFWALSSQNKTPQGGDSTVGFSIRDFIPFGSSETNDNVNTNYTTLPNNTQNNQTESTQNSPIPKLRKLSSEPVAGAVIFNKGTTSIVRFVEKGTGNVYEARSDSNTISRLTNTTIPKIVRAFWLSDGSGFLAQTLDSTQEVIETSFIKISNPIKSDSAENLTPFTTTISKLQTDIREIVINSENNKILYYVIGQNGSFWYTANPDGTNRELVLSHPLTEWLLKLFTNNTAVLQTKSSASYTSSAFVLDIKTKTLKRVGVSGFGLSVLPNYNLSPFLTSEGGVIPSMFIMNEETGKKISTNTNTMSEKCVWSKNKPISVFCAVPTSFDRATYPDDWYKGKTNTNDSIRKIDYINGVYSNISDLSYESGQKIDVVLPSISNDDSYLIFKNKIDGFLWMLNLN